jgi:peptidoglycan/LPS O-acetylase OafA/YrhL
VAYHQVPAFAAYFFSGCLIGHWQRHRPAQLPLVLGCAAWTALLVLLLAMRPDTLGAELLGWRGALLASACVLTVWLSGPVAVQGRAVALARWLGDVTYGTYLLHPMLFFGFAWFALPWVWPQPVEALPIALRWAVLAVVTAASCASATLSERYFERRLRAPSLRAKSRRPGPERNSASIST